MKLKLRPVDIECFQWDVFLQVSKQDLCRHRQLQWNVLHNVSNKCPYLDLNPGIRIDGRTRDQMFKTFLLTSEFIKLSGVTLLLIIASVAKLIKPLLYCRNAGKVLVSAVLES